MFNLFKKKTELETLQETYEKLLAESHRLSTVNRAASDAKRAEAEAIADKIEQMLQTGI
jgi:hypothetical protein